MFGEPLIDALDVEFVAKTSICQSWSVNENNLLKVAQLASRRLNRHAVQ